MIKLVMFTAILLAINTITAQWEWQLPVPQGNTLNDVYLITPSIGFAVGELGTIIKTEDGGVTFQVQDSDVQVNLNAIKFLSTQYGFAVGDGGTILETNNGGNSWENIDPGTSESLNDLYLKIPNKIWAVGNKGTLMMSSNGGHSWTSQYNDTTTDLTSIFFINEMEGWIGGHSEKGGIILKTEDAGNSWRVLSDSVSFSISTIHFTTSQIGWAIGNGSVYKTTDGGDTWLAQFEYEDQYNDIFFIDETNGWITGIGESVPVQGSVMRYTSDGGENWEYQNTTWGGLKSVYFVDNLNGCGVGNMGNIVSTSDCGYTWHVSCGNYSRPFLADVFFVDENYGWTVGGGYYPSYSTVLKSDDGGVDWYEQEAPNSFLTSVFFLNQEEGWITGTGSFAADNNLILHTTNGGTTWDIQYAKQGEWFFHALKDIEFLDMDKGWAIGGSQHVHPPQEPIILFTDNGGDDWNDYSYITDKSLSAIQFIDQEIGWIVGHELILKTYDGGQNWTELWTGYHSWIDFSFVDEYHGWIVGDSISGEGDVVMKTSDGGITWEKQFFNGSYFKKIFFTDQSNGWLIRNDQLFYTNDGGNSWILQFTGANTELGGLFFLNNDLGWIVGYNSSVLKTDKGGVVNLDEPSIIKIEKLRVTLFPNPFTTSTTIEYTLNSSQAVTINFYNQFGKQVDAIERQQPPGPQQVVWSPFNLSPGIYYIRLQAGEQVAYGTVVKM